mmetsp:Transcript_468/g.454  ORF Transcript_468/g.454 Transcript_468/m.454 type:complete len:89 (-) Transcript_468:2143-2409(-)
MKLESLDEYQLQNLGGYERLFPPMKYYHTTDPSPEEEQPPASLDPLSLKLWQMDQKVKQGRQVETRKLEWIEGNEIDQKTLTYYQRFL